MGSEDEDTIAQDVNRLRLTWAAFVHHSTDTPEGTVHAPPALIDCVSNIASRSLDSMGIGFDTEEGGREFFALVVYLGAQMYSFGQFCANQGLLQGNMVQCSCDAVDDDSLRQFMEGS